MPGTTSPLGFPYPVGADTLKETLTDTIPQLAEALDDYLSALSAVAGTGPSALTPLGSGWSGTVTYARRAGIVVAEIAVDKASWTGPDVVGTFPVGFRPVFETHGFGEYNASPRTFYVTTSGELRASTNQTGGIRGQIVLAV